MTFEEIDERYRAAVLTAENESGWDDPEETDDDDAGDDESDEAGERE